MTGWPATTLSEVLLEARPGFACGEAPSEGIFQFRMNNVTTDGQIDLSKKRRVPRDTPNVERFVVAPGDVLFNATNSPDLVGKAVHFPGLSEPAVFSNHFYRLRPRPERLDGRFLARWLNVQFQRGVFNGMCRQWVNQATVSRDALLALRMPIPPLPDQQRIAVLLDRADALRTKRRAALAQLDTLTQAIFLDMFGDPAANPRRWETKSVSELGDIVTGNTPSRTQSAYFGGTLEWIKSDNLSSGAYFATAAIETLSEAGRVIARVAPRGSILITCIAGSEASIGNSAMLNREAAFNQQINALIPRIGNPHFLMAQMRVGKALIQRASTASMKGMVSKRRFEEVRLMFPPEDLQNRFAAIAQRLEAMRSTQRRHLVELDALVLSLQDRAFRGEL